MFIAKLVPMKSILESRIEYDKATQGQSSLDHIFENMNLGYSHEDSKVTRKIYTDLIERSKFILCTNNIGTYIGRRHVEALAAGSVPVCFIENDTAARVLEELGYYDNINCLFFRSERDLINTAKEIKEMPEEKYLQMKKEGYKLLMERHLPGHRLLDIFNEVEKILD